MTGTIRRPIVAALVFALVVASACTSGGGGADRSDSTASERAAEPGERTDTMTDVDLAAEAYVAGYPLVVSMRTMQRLGGLLGVNTLFWQRALSGPSNRDVVAPNRDTLYSVAVLDLRSEPMALTLPEVNDRYFTYQFLDTWTESFAYVGTRETGGRAGTWVVVPPGWDGTVPEGADVLRSSTPLVFLLGRFLVDDDADIPEVTAISRQASLRPLSTLTGDVPPAPPPPLGAPVGRPQAIPTDATFFDELGDALAVNPPPTPAQRDLFAKLETLDQRELLDDGAARGDARIARAMEGRTRPVNGWTANREVGRYGDDLELRAVVARMGWGANVPEEAVYPVSRVDADGRRLDGGSRYRITFPAGELPPVDAFWSLSVYGPDMFFVPHPSGRYTIGDRTPGLVPSPDGSLEIVLSATEPAAPPGGGPVNWLPVPDGAFVLMLRLYLPGEAVLTGEYVYPPVERTDP